MGKVAPDMEVGPAAPVAAKKAKRGKKIVFGNEKKVLKAKAMEKQRIRSNRKCGIPMKTWMNFRDVPWLLLFVLAIAFIITVGSVSYTEYAAPSEFACDDCSSSRGGDPTPCSFDNYFSSMNLEVMRERETCIREALGSSYFDVDKDANIAAGTPNDCWATWNPDSLEWLDSKAQFGIRTQNRNATWRAEDHCVLKETPYHTIFKEGLWWPLVIVCTAPLVLSLVFTALLALAPHQFLDITFVAAVLSACAALGVCVWQSSLWGILWGFVVLLLGGLYAFARSRAKLTADMVIAQVAMLARIDFLVNIALVFLVGLLIYGGSFAWLAVFMRLHGRLSVVTDVFLFLVYLWVVAYLKNTLVVAAAQMCGAWYYRHLDVKHPMWEGWHRATSINAGSVALGSMFSGISRFLQVVAGFLRTRVSARMQVLAILAGLLDVLLRPINQYGYAFLVFANYKFTNASLEGLLLLTGTNMSLICPDAVIAAMQAAGAALCGTASLGAAYLMGRYVIADGDDGSRSLLMLALYVPALLFGYVVGLLPVNLMEGGTTMMYLAFAEDPLVLEETDDHLYMDLLDAWQVAVEEQQVLAEEDAGGVDVASEDALSHSSMESSDVDDEELAAMPNDRMKKWRKQLTMGGTNTAHQRSLFAQKLKKPQTAQTEEQGVKSRRASRKLQVTVWGDVKEIASSVPKREASYLER